MSYTLFGKWEEPQKEEVEKPPKKLKRVDLFRLWYTSEEKAKEDIKKINETHCWFTLSKVEWQLLKQWEKEDRRNK